MPDLAQVLADAREEAAVLRRNGAAFSIDRVEQFCDAVAAAAEDYLRFLPEPRARLYSGRSVAWLRARFAGWAEQGHAERRKGVRYYRVVVLPRRPDTDAAFDEGLSHAS